MLNNEKSFEMKNNEINEDENSTYAATRKSIIDNGFIFF